MTFLGELRVEAVLESLRTISYFVHGIGQRLRLTEQTLFDIDLAVEETSANIVRYAYPPGRADPPGQAGEMVVRIETMEDVVHITLTDWGVPLDPDDVRPFDIHAPVETRIEGGMGLHLIHSVMDDVARQTAPAPGGPNTTTLTKRIERLPPGTRRPGILGD
jgi:anti-sigma regulatory factor (Ser/Thr protein kinase)